jgi:GAF domain-containing protein
MSDVRRETRLVRTFATLADSLTADFDVVDLLQTLVDTCIDVFDVQAAGILLADQGGHLELISSTSEATTLVEMMQLAAEQGPCIACFRSGAAVSLPQIADAPPEWSQFRDSAIEQGFAAVDALPMRLRDQTLGTLNLLRTTPGSAPEDDLLAAQGFADVATIGILNQRYLRESAVVATQLQRALQSRVLIEQAKGVISHTHDVAIDVAFSLIRQYARSHGLTLSVTAARIVDRSLQIPR